MGACGPGAAQPRRFQICWSRAVITATANAPTATTPIDQRVFSLSARKTAAGGHERQRDRVCREGRLLGAVAGDAPEVDEGDDELDQEPKLDHAGHEQEAVVDEAAARGIPRGESQEHDGRHEQRDGQRVEHGGKPTRGWRAPTQAPAC